METGKANRPGAASGVDWPLLLRRHQEASADLVEGAAEDPGETRRILQARAAELARRPEAAPDRESRLECLSFQLSEECYAVELSFITQTVPLADFTPLFCTPEFVLGITNLRGRIVSIIDLRRFFELPQVGLSNLNRVIVVSDGKMEFGILADSVNGTVSLPLAELQPPPAALTGIREEFLTGVTPERLALLDIRKILRDRRIVVHEEVS